MTELSYSISDIQTRIFEIQEIRHQTQTTRDPQSSSSGVIDQALMSLDERLEAVNRGMKSVADALEPLLSQTPKQTEDEDERTLLLRKHKALVTDWESVQDETDVLREELKEDKWLTVFRTVSEQADGMMTSLEKAIQRCQEFIWRVRKRVPSEDATLLAQASPSSRDAAPLTYETFRSLQDSYEAKKKHYTPATSKVLSIIDKGVQDRVTKNGECLRRHAESTQRWKNLKERIQRTDADMETTRKILLMQGSEADEFGSVISEKTSRSSVHGNGHLITPQSSTGSRRISNSIESLSNSISPLRKLAKRIGGRMSGRATPVSKEEVAKPPASDPLPTVRNRRSMFPLRGVTNLATPERPMHKHSQSMTPESPTTRRTGAEETIKFKAPRWNSSTKVESEEPTRPVRPSLSRKSSAANMRSVSSNYPPVPPIPPMTPNPPRSLSRASFASSRPWSPITASNGSTTRSSISRPPSRSQSSFGFATNPRARPRTPSHIPMPINWKGSSASSDTSFDDRSPPDSSIMQRISPTRSTSSISGISSYSRAKTPLGTHIPYPRPPSRSKIPVPTLSFSSASRPSSAMSDYFDRPDTSMSFRSSALRAQTPEATLRGRVQQLPYFHDNASSISPGLRRSSRAPPSSYRREPSVAPPLPHTPLSRPGSRAGAYTPSFESRSMHTYIPANPKDPLDAEVAAIGNSIPHGLLIERIDPPLRVIPKDNEEIKAQYAFSNHLARKIVACRLLTMSRSGVKSKKVMCRVGGGWQELSLYLLSRQAGN
ncbi:uncharacterized protein FOMMEDRAFT_73499 [Fomitiporia mediterranea MF3/22]|uniref:uncharacterized protein n=1 Tax=Fomitiporia mediterranea (strain MF3/22) TaxID=694068 RepID=UPI000440833B|nr:uncharacterized protein FOMMEDRAFT_73499 [Fomitiporia mediterranea MF3/22]EJD07527.1 hypothetical protein FOMMEDRAFT_73499 [Fomitiporia mediterranea MF3/22]